ncbi:MAG: NAD(P)/FAD-dependent oxidoreductase [Deltaproteobacteria bacterium]|nr:NAD(P)/FAD-dependent oxidoreductase [Deltaproteobacteria bacterium]
MAKRYDVLVIGTGTAGLTAADELNRKGLTVGMVEHSKRPGGTCALRGCQAKKWFYEGAETVARSRDLSGIGSTAPATASWRALRDAKNRYTAKVPDNTVNGLKEANIDLIRGRARFTGPVTLSVDDHPLSAKYIVLATGAVPVQLPIDGANFMLTSTEFMELAQLPPRITFIGGGFISFEFAHFAARMGSTGHRCTILENGPHPLRPFDREMVDLLTKASKREGIDIVCDVDVEAIRKDGDGFSVLTKGGRRFESDIVVNGAGRSANIKDLDLSKAGIESKRGGITVDRKMATTNAQVYAVGDCAATVQLARVADAEAKVAADAIAGHIRGEKSKSVMDYSAVPTVLFSYPQYGMVGATEDSLKDKGMAYRKRFEKGLDWPTYKRVGMTSAAYKVLVGEDGRLLGAHLLSDNTTGLITIFTLAMVNNIAIDVLFRQSIMTPYPSRESDIIYMLKPFV